MSNRSSAATPDGDRQTDTVSAGDRDATAPTERRGLDGRARLAGWGRPERLIPLVGGITLLVALFRLGVVVLTNLPFDPVAVPPAVRTLVSIGTPLIAGLALVSVALVADQAPARVGLLFAGVFALLGWLDPAATLPGVLGVTGGGALALLGTVSWPPSDRSLPRLAVAAWVVTATLLTLSGAIGLGPAGIQSVGSLLALLGLVALGLAVADDWPELVAGAIVAVTVAALGATSPYVAGSALLVGFGVAGVPHVFVALAAGGASVTLATGLRYREADTAVGAGLLLVAGVPVTLPRATLVVLGAVLVLLGVERLRPSSAGTVPEVSA